MGVDVERHLHAGVSQAALDEVNFWQPGGGQEFKALAPGALFLFKLHSPLNFVVGGGVFAHWSRLPLSMAWETFGIANGARCRGSPRRRSAANQPPAILRSP